MIDSVSEMTDEQLDIEIIENHKDLSRIIMRETELRLELNPKNNEEIARLQHEKDAAYEKQDILRCEQEARYLLAHIDDTEMLREEGSGYGFLAVKLRDQLLAKNGRIEELEFKNGVLSNENERVVKESLEKINILEEEKKNIQHNCDVYGKQFKESQELIRKFREENKNSAYSCDLHRRDAIHMQDELNGLQDEMKELEECLAKAQSLYEEEVQKTKALMLVMKLFRDKKQS